jgi:hypothetical protein
MSEDSTSEDEQPEVDDSTLSEVVRRPTRTAGDLSEVADASPGITTEDLARDLEAVASKRGVPTESELLADLLRASAAHRAASRNPQVLTTATHMITNVVDHGPRPMVLVGIATPGDLGWLRR